jgi:phosphatidylglycerophosphate synthase
MGKVSLKDIRATYPSEKMAWEKRNKVWLYYAGRLPSFYVTWLFLRLNISANQATYICLVTGLASCIFLALGSYILKLTGAILASLYLLLDCVDGNIARYTKSESALGKFIDATGSYVVSAFLFMSLGVGVYTNPDSCFLLRVSGSIPLWLKKDVYLAAGFWSSFSYVLARLISLRYKTMLGLSEHDNKGSNTQADKLCRIGTMALKNIFGVAGFFVPLLLLAVAFALLDLLTIFYAGVNTAALVSVVIESTMKIKSIGN